MKLISFPLAAAGLLVTGCAREKIDFGGSEPDSQDGYGYLSLSGLSLGINEDAEINDTRVAVGAPDSYLVSIIDVMASEEVYFNTYGEIQKLTEAIPLPAGTYRIEARSCEESAIPLMAWELPVYYGSTSASVIKNTTTQVSDLICTLNNIKTTVYLDDALKDLFLNDGTDDVYTIVSLGDSAMKFERDESRAAYFKAVDASNTLTVVLSGSYNTAASDETPVYKHVSMTKTISGVRAGEWRKISISVQHTDEGNVTFTIEVATWVNDETIDVDVMSERYSFGEEVIPDEDTSDADSPVVTLNNHDIAAPFVISSSLFNDEDLCTDRIEVNVTPVGDASVSSVKAEFDSENEAFLKAFAGAGLSTAVDMTDGLTLDGVAYVTVKNSGTSKILTASSKAMKAMLSYPGTHTVRFVVKDSQNRTSYTKMTITVKESSSSEGGPTIEWQNHDIDTRYSTSDLSGSDCVVIDIHSDTGITGLTVDILGGNVLSDAELASLGLASHMDLVNPATDEMDAFLNQLGFKTKDAVKTNDVQFNISDFMPMLAGLGNSGNCDFKLTVTDASGSNTKTIMLTVVPM